MNKRYFSGLIVLLASGCAISPNAELKQKQLTAHDVLATDSRLRVIAETEQGIFSTSGQVEPIRILCTEPSPDIATTLANSFGVGINVMNYGSGSLSSAQVEGLVQLGERTAAIQLVRDKMYQTCLAYANGAISATNYSLIMSRLDDAIITMSLGDNAAGAFGRKLAGVGGEANADAETAFAGLTSNISDIQDYASKLATANKKVDDASNELEKHNALTTPENATEKAAYDKQTGELEEKLKAAKQERDDTIDLMRGTARNASQNSARITKLETGGSITPNQNAAVMQEIQSNFLESADITKEFVNTCLVELGNKKPLNNNLLDNDKEKLSKILLEAAGPSIGIQETITNYIGWEMKNQKSELSVICKEKLPEVLQEAIRISTINKKQQLDFRQAVATARYTADIQTAEARRLEAFNNSLKLCNEIQDDKEKLGCKKAIGLSDQKIK